MMARDFLAHADFISVFSVAMLTAGIGVAAMADAQAKVDINLFYHTLSKAIR